jgi:Zn-finger in ubiquitin-hydrolases and other protein
VDAVRRFSLRNNKSRHSVAATMATFFSLKVNLSPEIDDVNRSELLKTIYLAEKRHHASLGAEIDASSELVDEGHDIFRVPIVCCESFSLSPAPSMSYENISSRFVAVFCPPTLVDTALEQARQPNQSRNGSDGSAPQYSIVEWIDNPTKISEVLLSLIHPFLSQNFTIQAILTSICDNKNTKTSSRSRTAVSLVVLNLAHCPYSSIIDDLLDATNGDVIRSGPEAILKVLLLSNLELHALCSVEHYTSSMMVQKETKVIDTVIEIPTCAVCLHRIEPSRLGLPRPRSHNLCSKFCPPINKNCDLLCPRQHLLQPWPHPCYCEACHVIWNYWKRSDAFGLVADVYGGCSNEGNVSCSDCGMRETLWVCLTCGLVGCGRYSNKHASEHNRKTHHPFCLELSTLRIWSYVDSEYVHRLDLLECPSSLQNRPLQPPNGYLLSATFPLSVASAGTSPCQMTSLDQVQEGDNSFVYSDNAVLSSSGLMGDPALFQQHSAENYDRIIASSLASVDGKTPKKATMIGEEYEVLLQSALEEQAQFYDGEISWLRASLTGMFHVYSFLDLLLQQLKLIFSSAR